MNGALVDTSVLLDVATSSRWSNTAHAHIRAYAEQGPLYVNPIIYAELAPAFESIILLDQWLSRDRFERAPLPYSAGWLAGQAFATYRRRGGPRLLPLPDFYIGAHAQVDGLVLITRDPARVKTHFPSVKIVVPS